MSAETPDDNEQASADPGVTRRELFRRGATAATTTAAIGAAGTEVAPRYSPVGRARAALPLVPIGAGLAGAAVGAYVGDKVSDYFADDEDLTEYTGSDALHMQIAEKAQQLAVDQEQIMSSLENTVQFADNAALPKGMAAIVESLNNGDSAGTAVEKMETAIDEEYYDGVQQDILSAYRNVMDQMSHWFQSLKQHTAVDNDTSIAPSDVLVMGTYDGAVPDGTTFKWMDSPVKGLEPLFDRNVYLESMGSHQINDREVTLASGATETAYMYRYNHDNQSNYGEFHPVNTGVVESPLRVAVKPHDYRGESVTNIPNSELIEYVEIARFRRLWDELQASRQRVHDNLSTLVDDVFSQYEAGEVDLSEFVDPMTAYTELSSKEDDLAYAGAAASMLGIPRHDQPMDIYLKESEVTVSGSIYSTSEPTDGYEVGSTIDPANYDYPIFLSYEGTFEDENGEVQEQVDFVQLEQPFTIESATDSDGNELSSVQMSDGPTYDTSDVESLQKQLEQIRQEQLEMQERAEEQNSGASGGFFDFGSDGPGVGVILAAAAAVFALASNN